MLNSLHIKNFRLLEDFQVTALGRVNLIVGKNNSGKSTVLEALRIYAGNANRDLLESIAQSHDEKYFLDKNVYDGFDTSLPYADLFTHRAFPAGEQPIVIGEMGHDDTALKIYHAHVVEKKYTVTDELNNQETIIKPVTMTSIDLKSINKVLGEGLLIKKDKEAITIDFSRISPDVTWFIPLGHSIPCSFIPTQFVAMDELANLWDSIVFTAAEATVKEAMKIILPDFEDITFVNVSAFSKNNAFRRIAKVKIIGIDSPVPLASLGDGMLRILQLVLKLFAAKGGFLLIDEFENGLHYSVQEKVWLLLFELSVKLDIQVFATTHSWDCIESFAKVAMDKKDIDSVLFRVGKSVRNSDKGRVISTVFNQEQLFSITQSDVEVR